MDFKKKIDLFPKDILWCYNWITVVSLLIIWDFIFLNKPAFKKVLLGFVNTVFMSLFVVIFTLVVALLISNLILYAKKNRKRFLYTVIMFLLQTMRSVPQIVGLLFGYIWVASMASNGLLGGKIMVFIILALIITMLIFQEVIDLILERVEHYKKLDFYSAMLVCGIGEFRIVNFDILWKNSRIHIFNKLISIFGMAIFLSCSVDFIISVGLSTSISLVDLPATLGTLLANIDSKQDILAIGNTLTNPAYFPHLFKEHLQGVTAAILLVFTLVSVYKIANGYAERHRL